MKPQLKDYVITDLNYTTSSIVYDYKRYAQALDRYIRYNCNQLKDK